MSDNPATPHSDSQPPTGDADLQRQIADLTARVAEVEAMLAATQMWMAALSGDILKSHEALVLRLTDKDLQRRKLLLDEVFENYYRLNPDARPKDD
jgi:septal ring factor EnvC (AmiA/AmiB activator)